MPSPVRGAEDKKESTEGSDRDRFYRTRQGISLALVAVVAAGACNDSVLRPLEPGEKSPFPASGVKHAVDAARGVLTYAVAFAGDHTLLSVELELAFALVVRRIESGRTLELHRIHLGKADYDIEDLAVDVSGRRAWVASRDGTVRGIELASGRTAPVWHLGSSATAVAVSPQRGLAATGTADGIVCLRRMRDGALLQCVAAHRSSVSGLDFDPRGHSLVSVSWDGQTIVWRVPSLAVAARHSFTGSANRAAFSPDGGQLAIAASDHPPVRRPASAPLGQEQRHRGTPGKNAVYVWTLGSHMPHVERPDVPARDAKRSSDRAERPSGQLFDQSDGPAEDARRAMIRSFTGHTGPVTAVAWSPDSERVLSASWDRTVRMWDVGRDQVRRRPDPAHLEIARVGGFSGPVRALAVDSVGRHIAVGAWVGSLDGRSSVLLQLLYRARPQTGE